MASRISASACASRRPRAARRGRASRPRSLEQQEAALDVGCQHLRRVQAGALRSAAATCTKGRTSSCGGGASITMQLPPLARVDAQVAPEARIGRGRRAACRERRPCAAASGASQRSKAAWRAGSGQAMAAAVAASWAHRVVRAGRSAAALVDNRFYKPAARRAGCASCRSPAFDQPLPPCRPRRARPVPRLATRAGAGRSRLLLARCRRRGRRGATPHVRRSARAEPRAASATARSEPPLIAARRRAARPPRPGRVAEGHVELRRGGMRDPRRPAELRPGRGPCAARRGNVRISRDGNASAAPSCSCKLQRFEGFFLQPELPLRAHRRRRPAPSASTSSTSQRASSRRRHLHQLPARRRAATPAWLLERRPRQARLRGQRRHRRGRGAALSAACRSWPRRC